MKTDLESAHRETVQRARDNVIMAIKSRGDVAQATADAVTGLLTASGWDPLLQGDALVLAVATGAVRGAVELGVGMNRVAHGILRAAIDAGDENEAPILDVVRQTSRSTVHAVAGIDADVGSAVKGLLAAAAAGAAARGITQQSAAQATSDGALMAVSESGYETSELVRQALSSIDGPLNVAL